MPWGTRKKAQKEFEYDLFVIRSLTQTFKENVPAFAQLGKRVGGGSAHKKECDNLQHFWDRVGFSFSKTGSVSQGLGPSRFAQGAHLFHGLPSVFLIVADSSSAFVGGLLAGASPRGEVLGLEENTGPRDAVSNAGAQHGGAAGHAARAAVEAQCWLCADRVSTKPKHPARGEMLRDQLRNTFVCAYGKKEAGGVKIFRPAICPSLNVVNVGTPILALAESRKCHPDSVHFQGAVGPKSRKGNRVPPFDPPPRSPREGFYHEFYGIFFSTSVSFP